MISHSFLLLSGFRVTLSVNEDSLMISDKMNMDIVRAIVDNQNSYVIDGGFYPQKPPREMKKLRRLESEQRRKRLFLFEVLCVLDEGTAVVALFSSSARIYSSNPQYCQGGLP